MKSHHDGRRSGFTLVELLVVIGIITILISILLPALSKVRRQAQGTACLSNMRQLAAAVLMYANENRYWMPCRAGAGLSSWSGGSPNKQNGYTQNCSNWIAWQYDVDPYQGNTPVTSFGTYAPPPTTATTNDGDQNITYSALAPYLNIPFTVSDAYGAGGLPTSNSVSAQYGKVFLCPSDDPQQRPKSMAVAIASQQNYYYSYGMNAWIDNPISYVDGNTANPAGGSFAKSARSWGTFNGKITSIGNTADIVLMIDQDPRQNSSGEVTLTSNQWYQGFVNSVNPVHYGNTNASSALTGTSGINQDGYGNASFCDGHAAEVSRKDVLRSQHSGDPEPDPPAGTTGTYGTW